jgi:serine/threonine protein kinase
MSHHRTFAVKQILCGPNQTGAEVAVLAELEREIDVMKRLSHPNLVRYLGTERTDDELYIAMEYVRGGALADLIKRIAAQQGRQRQQRMAAEAAAVELASVEGRVPPTAVSHVAPQIVLPLRTIASYAAQILAGAFAPARTGLTERARLGPPLICLGGSLGELPTCVSWLRVHPASGHPASVPHPARSWPSGSCDPAPCPM